MQRVSRASVSIEGITVGAIERGFLILVGFIDDDTVEKVSWICRKISGLRIFEDESGKMNLSLREIGGSLLIVSQFTLYADVKKGNRPSFVNAARPEFAEELYDLFCESLKKNDIHVEQGVFGAMMEVDLVNVGPVTIMIEK